MFKYSRHGLYSLTINSRLKIYTNGSKCFTMNRIENPLNLLRSRCYKYKVAFISGYLALACKQIPCNRVCKEAYLPTLVTT